MIGEAVHHAPPFRRERQGGSLPPAIGPGGPGPTSRRETPHRRLTSASSALQRRPTGAPPAPHRRPTSASSALHRRLIGAPPALHRRPNGAPPTPHRRRTSAPPAPHRGPIDALLLGPHIHGHIHLIKERGRLRCAFVVPLAAVLLAAPCLRCAFVVPLVAVSLAVGSLPVAALLLAGSLLGRKCISLHFQALIASALAPYALLSMIGSETKASSVFT